MNIKHWMCACALGLALVLSGQPLYAQQSDADRKLLADIRAKAEKGDAQSQYELGRVFYFGHVGLAKDEAEAVKWFRKAADQNHAEAQFWYAYCCYTGRGVAKDEAEAVKWYRKAAEQDSAGAQCNLGNCYISGRGVAKDEVEAVKWWLKAAAQNQAYAQCNLGNCYYSGRGVAKDEVEAVQWYRKAAEQNFAGAQFSLGICYETGQGVAKDEAEAVKWYRKAAEQNFAGAQFSLGICYYFGLGVAKDEAEAVKWYRKAAEQDSAGAQYYLGNSYFFGQGVAKDEAEAVKWHRKAAEQNFVMAQYSLGVYYENGQGVAKDEAEAVKWYRKAAEQDYANAQYNLGVSYAKGQGVPKDEVESYKWFLLAGAQGDDDARKAIDMIEKKLTREQVAEGQKLARNFKPREVPASGSPSSGMAIAETRPSASGSGFFITEDGYLVTNQHVVEDGGQVRIVTATGLIFAKVVKVDAANDLALLKADGKFAVLPVAPSRGVNLGATVATVGFPNIGLQGFAPKLSKGEIAALSGAQDDARHFQISNPIQPGNSGGALVDQRGNVVGVVVAKLSQRAALAATGALPENVNYAVKSSYLLSFLESVPAVAAKLKDPSTKDRPFEDVVKDAEKAAVLVLIY